MFLAVIFLPIVAVVLFIIFAARTIMLICENRQHWRSKSGIFQLSWIALACVNFYSFNPFLVFFLLITLCIAVAVWMIRTVIQAWLDQRYVSCAIGSVFLAPLILVFAYQGGVGLFSLIHD